MNTKVFIIIVPQEYKNANHYELWNCIAKLFDGITIIIDIPADAIVSRIKNKKYRIYESRQKFKRIGERSYIIRPYFIFRPEICGTLYHTMCAKKILRMVKNYFKTDESNISVLAYNAFWICGFAQCNFRGTMAYYLYDEVRMKAETGKIDTRKYKYDEIACKNADVVFTMTKKIADSRKQLNSNVIVIGNGAIKPKLTVHQVEKYPNSIAFVGNFRDWIDQELFMDIVGKKQDISFYIVGSIENNMKEYLKLLQNKFDNISYLGRVKKDEMVSLYRKFDGIIIPYKNNEFIKSTRPIKIVESVLAGTPVVTIPMDGYAENSFIRFANNTNEFCNEIDFIRSHPIEINSEEYLSFVNNNTWEHKANVILEALIKI